MMIFRNNSFHGSFTWCDFLRMRLRFLIACNGLCGGNDTVHMVQLQWIFVCDITHEWVPHPFCAIVMCDSKYTYMSHFAYACKTEGEK